MEDADLEWRGFGMKGSGMAVVVQPDAFQRVKLPDYIRSSKSQCEGTAFYGVKEQYFYEDEILKGI